MEITTNEKQDTVLTNVNSRIVILGENGEQIKIKVKDNGFEVKYSDNKIILNEGSIDLKKRGPKGQKYWI
jgi:hypothetical protein